MPDIQTSMQLFHMCPDRTLTKLPEPKDGEHLVPCPKCGAILNVGQDLDESKEQDDGKDQ